MSETRTDSFSHSVKHISVCICTYKRSEMLNRLLNELNFQRTDGLFQYSVVVVDNDATESGKEVVLEAREKIKDRN